MMYNRFLTGDLVTAFSYGTPDGVRSPISNPQIACHTWPYADAFVVAGNA